MIAHLRLVAIDNDDDVTIGLIPVPPELVTSSNSHTCMGTSKYRYRLAGRRTDRVTGTDKRTDGKRD